MAGEDKGLGAVKDRRRNGGGDETDNDENGACDACVGVGEAIGCQDLAYDGGDGVEEADVDEEGNQKEPDFEGRDDDSYGGQ